MDNPQQTPQSLDQARAELGDPDTWITDDNQISPAVLRYEQALDDTGAALLAAAQVQVISARALAADRLAAEETP